MPSSSNPSGAAPRRRWTAPSCAADGRTGARRHQASSAAARAPAGSWPTNTAEDAPQLQHWICAPRGNRPVGAVPQRPHWTGALLSKMAPRGPQCRHWSCTSCDSRPGQHTLALPLQLAQDGIFFPLRNATSSSRAAASAVVPTAVSFMASVPGSSWHPLQRARRAPGPAPGHRPRGAGPRKQGGCRGPISRRPVASAIRRSHRSGADPRHGPGHPSPS